MAREVRSYSGTIPAGTAKTAPVTLDMSFPPRVVDRIIVTVPTGCNGSVGFRIIAAGMPVIPIQLNTWIVTSGTEVSIPTDGYHDSGSWQLQAYNTGNFDHTLSVLFHLSLVATDSTPPAMIPPQDISQPATDAGGDSGSGVPVPTDLGTSPVPTPTNLDISAGAP